MTLPYLTRGDIGGIILLIAILGLILFAAVKGPQIMGNYGFGPEWTCVSPGKGGPICIKAVAKEVKAAEPAATAPH